MELGNPARETDRSWITDHLAGEMALEMECKDSLVREHPTQRCIIPAWNPAAGTIALESGD